LIFEIIKRTWVLQENLMNASTLYSINFLIDRPTSQSASHQNWVVKQIKGKGSGFSHRKDGRNLEKAF
jgi:hypothetical protein